MLFLFADESGDVNFAKGTRYFVYVGIVTPSKKKCEQILVQLKEGYFELFHKQFPEKELKASNLYRDEMIYFLKGLKNLDFEVYYAYIDTYNKSNSFNYSSDLNAKKLKLLELVISGALSIHGSIGKIIIDKGLPQVLRHSLRIELNNRFKNVPKIDEESSQKVAGIQIADLVAGSINRHLKGDSLYYSYIEDKIKLKIEI